VGTTAARSSRQSWDSHLRRLAGKHERDPPPRRSRTARTAAQTSPGVRGHPPEPTQLLSQTGGDDEDCDAGASTPSCQVSLRVGRARRICCGSPLFCPGRHPGRAHPRASVSGRVREALAKLSQMPPLQRPQRFSRGRRHARSWPRDPLILDPQDDQHHGTMVAPTPILAA
jgi:hypothetical protein